MFTGSRTNSTESCSSFFFLLLSKVSLQNSRYFFHVSGRSKLKSWKAPFPVARVPRFSLASRLPSLARKMRKNNTNLEQGAHIHQPTATIIINNNNACSAGLSKVCEVFSAIAGDCYQNFWPSCARAKRGRISKIPYKEEIVGSLENSRSPEPAFHYTIV